MKSKIPSIRLKESFPKDVRDKLSRDLVEFTRLLSDDVALATTSTASGVLGPQSIDPVLHGAHGDSVAAVHQLNQFLSKYSDQKSSTLRKTNALSKFLLCEVDADQTNKRLACYTSFDSDTHKENIRNEGFLSVARREIARLISYKPPEVNELLNGGRFGPGSSLGETYDHKSTYYKYLRWPYACPAAGLSVAREAINNDQRWFGSVMDTYRNEVVGDQYVPINMETFWATVLSPTQLNRVTTVPKNADTDRTIAIEPSLGIYLQLGVDGVFRRALKRWGINLDDQDDNQSAALSASVDDDLATLDLSSASDCVTTELVRDLLPDAWFQYLDSIRSRYGLMPDGTTIEYQKFSSMGNGFTFALESLLFAALCRAVVPRSEWPSIYVYGDDIIVPTAYVADLVSLLSYTGFSVNDQKSFDSGPFRESCGCDAWNGMRITPVRLKEMPTSLSDLYSLYNRLYTWYENFKFKYRLNGTVVPFPETLTGREIVSHIPTSWTLMGPPDSRYLRSWLFCEKLGRIGSVYECRGICTTQASVKPKDIRFAKLMHSLRPAPKEIRWWEQKFDESSLFRITSEDVTEQVRLISAFFYKSAL